jgi:hypothetical protein
MMHQNQFMKKFVSELSAASRHLRSAIDQAAQPLIEIIFLPNLVSIAHPKKRRWMCGSDFFAGAPQKAQEKVNLKPFKRKGYLGIISLS